MVMIAFKTFSECPEEQRPVNINLSWPWQEQYCSSSEEALQLQENGFTVVTEDQYSTYKKLISPQVNIEDIITKAIVFGDSLLKEFAAQNVLLGITQEGKTGEVLAKLSGVMTSMQAGSLYEAIVRIKAIPSTEYDTKYVTASRLVAFLNKIEGYLGIPLTESL
jgi:hypothetical protein